MSEMEPPDLAKGMETEPVEEDTDLDTLLAEVQEHATQSEKMLQGDSLLHQATDVVEVPEEEEFDEKEIDTGVRIFDLSKQENCIHEVAVPLSIEFKRRERKIENPAKTFKFTLDPFQNIAIDCVDQLQSVLVSAHTSAGKTVTALYAIALALRDKQRVIYTTPIKALSNQKYCELNDEFGDVGLMTGDVTLNPEASCLVMTTEILRSMLYRGSEIMREVGWVIFDEIHYMRDEERGVVWEETIILLPDNVHYVFLSATIPNAKEFASWIASIHNQICHIVYTDYRPTPLQHVFYSSGSNGLYEVVSTKGEFREDQLMKAMSFVNEAPTNEKTRQRRQQALQENASNVTILIRTVRERDLLPCIVFSFSRKECEAYATGLRDMDFNNAQQKEMIKAIFFNAIELLSEEDQKLPQIKWILPFLLRGIGIHHSGLLPLLKESIELLFGEGLLKVLFATETFSMGLNMPARTVLFTSARKFDGRDNRWISSGEYIQMSGRAGRRGLDTQGLVILMVDQKMSVEIAKNIVKGHTDPLNSQFRLTYNMVLNLTRVPEVNPEYMMERSFRYFQNKLTLPPLYKEYKTKKTELDLYKVNFEEEMMAYQQLKNIATNLREKIQQIVLQPKYIAPYLQAGRLFKIKTTEADLGWAALLDSKKTINKMSETIFMLEMAVILSWDCIDKLKNLEKLRPPKPNETGTTKFIAVELSCVTNVSSIRIKLPDKLDTDDKTKNSIGLTLKRSLEKFDGYPPELDPIEDLKIRDKLLKEHLDHLTKVQGEMAVYPLCQRDDFKKICSEFEKKAELSKQLKTVKDAIRKAKNIFSEELEARKRLLRRMGYIDNYNNIIQKGRIACEISAANEIVTTEMLFTGAFNDLSSADAAALLSCFVFDDRTERPSNLDEKLVAAYQNLLSHAKKVCQVSVECKLDVNEKDYMEKFQSSIMPVVKQWCQGSSFLKISVDSGIFEGSIIRCLRRLEELMREMENASKSMGNEQLCAVFEKAIKELKRDIVFAASLYL